MASTTQCNWFPVSITEKHLKQEFYDECWSPVSGITCDSCGLEQARIVPVHSADQQVTFNTIQHRMCSSPRVARLARPQLSARLWHQSAGRTSLAVHSLLQTGHSPRRMCYCDLLEGITTMVMGTKALAPGLPGMCPSRMSKISGWRGVWRECIMEITAFCIVK